MDQDQSKPGTSRSSADEDGASGGPAEKPVMSLVDYMNLPENQDANMVVPLTWCPHLEFIDSSPDVSFDDKSPCLECQNVGENWICLVCRKVYCSRYVNEHMVEHNSTTGHQMALSMADISVWCYSCDYYVDNDKLYSMKNAIHKSKFGEDMPRVSPRDAGPTFQLT